MTRTTGRQWVRLVGLLLSAAALAWIAVRFAKSGALELLTHASASPLGISAWIVLGACAYSLAMCLPALAWWRLVSALAPAPVPVRNAIVTYAVSQYGKYLPGNVAHYAIRHAWSRRAGLPHASLGLAAMLEAALLLLAALAATLLGDTTRLRIVSMIDSRIAIVLLLVILGALGTALAFARRHSFAERWHVPALPSASVLLSCLACYAAFFAASAALLELLAYVLGFGVESFALLLAAGAASWAAGFIVIGAPGGLGVREAAFVALAGGALGESHALLLIGLFRIVTFLGDTLLFAAGALALRGADGAIGDSSRNHRSAP